MATERFEVECPGCGEEVSIPMEEFVDVSLDPEKKEQIIDGSFFLHSCPGCEAGLLIEYPLMYMDPDKKLNVYMAPDPEEDLLDQLNSLDIPAVDADTEEKFRLVPNGVSLMEKILIAEAGRDDRLIELYKYVIWEQVEEVWPDLVPGDLLYMYDEDGEYFVIWPSDNGKDEKLTVPLELDVYHELETNYLVNMEIPATKYAQVDQAWIGERFER